MDSKRGIKFIVILLLIVSFISGITYTVYKYTSKEEKVSVEVTPNTSINENKDTDDNILNNKLWIGTFNLVWNDFMDKEIGGPIKFVDGESKLADELNKQSFKEDQLNPDSLYKVMCPAITENKVKIEKDLLDKFNEKSEFLDRVLWDAPNNYIVYAMLKKEFNYLEKFPNLNSRKFKDYDKEVKYFGMDPSSTHRAKDSLDILFYNNEDDFAVRLNTKENEEVYLYKNKGIDKSFEEVYKELINKTESYTGDNEFNTIKDTIAIPYIKVKDEISYDELCNRNIVGSDAIITKALQNIDFELNNCGGLVKSEALIEYTKNAIEISNNNKIKTMIFDDDFILFMKEKGKEKPYMALKVDNIDTLVIDEATINDKESLEIY